jgi:CBS-domain-containing membrane protein
LRHIREEEKATGVTAGDLMTAPAITISPDATVEQAARLMYDRRVKRLPVVNASRRLLGIISRVDVLAVYDRPDRDIQNEVYAGRASRNPSQVGKDAAGGCSRGHRDDHR